MIPPEIIRTPQGVYVLRDDTHLSRWIEQHGRLDIAEGEIATFAKYIPKGGIVIDAGASLGDHAATYAKLVSPSGLVLAFEPSPLTFAALELNFKDVPYVTTINAALSDTSGSGEMNLNANIGASTFSKGKGSVACVTLDSIMPSLGRLDFIHLDCEGMEIDAINGGRKLITKFRPAMVIEVNKGCLARVGKTEADLVALLAELGYEVRELEPHFGPHLEQRDILAVPIST